MYKDSLIKLRDRNGLAQRRFAEMLNLKYSTYCDYENEKAIFPIKHLNTLCNELNISFDYLFNLSNRRSYKNSTLYIDKSVCGKRLKEFRKENNLTQDKLAKILNIALGTISGYEKGKYLITTHALYDIVTKYHISADYLLGKIDQKIIFK